MLPGILDEYTKSFSFGGVSGKYQTGFGNLFGIPEPKTRNPKPQTPNPPQYHFESSFG